MAGRLDVTDPLADSHRLDQRAGHPAARHPVLRPGADLPLVAVRLLV
jgi:hypothetical protein